MTNRVPSVPGLIEALNTADWSETFSFNLDGQPRVFTGSTFTAALKATISGQEVKVVITDIQVDGNEVTVRVALSNPLIAPGLYEGSLTEHRADGVVETRLTWKIAFREGPEA